MSQFQFDNSGLARLIPNFRPSDFWFLHRQFNPAFGLFTNLFVDDQPPATQIAGSTGIFTRPVTLAALFRPNGTAASMVWGFPPFANTLSMICDEAGLLTVNAGAPSGTDDRVTGSVQLPLNRMSFVVMSVRPGDAQLRLWRNGRLILRAESPNGVLRDGQWSGDLLPGQVNSSDPENPTIVGNRVAVFLNQLPRAFN